LQIIVLLTKLLKYQQFKATTVQILEIRELLRELL